MKETLSTSADKSYAPHLALFLVQLMFGSAPVVGKIALETFPSEAIVAIRVVAAALAFYFLQRTRGGSMRLDRPAHYFYFAVFSFFGVVVNQYFFFGGLARTTATNTSLLAVMIPVFAFIVSALIGNEKFSWQKISGIALAGAGVIYLIDPARASFSSATTLGDIMIILNSLSYAVYLALSKKLIAHYGALKSIAWIFLFGCVVYVPVGFFSLQTAAPAEVSHNAWLAIAAIVIFPTILAYYFNTWSLARVEPSVVAVYVYLQPLIGTALAILLLGESWKPRIFLAMLLIFAGVFLVTRRGKTSNAAAAEVHLTAN
jgi:drug/metabolite transporter (DMT)-like permease